MTKFWKFFEYAYLVIAVVLFVDGFTRLNTEPQKAYLIIGFGVLAIFMYFFKKRMRKRFEERNTNQNQ
ncbi:MAG: hypothetical protein R2821_13770 [Flavobacteriaceae bacterium]|jgi:uncharacterized membrane protein YuzA (DUF378 family)|nr:hypothetical protein [Flavobacteriaceae bacterium]